MTGSQRKIAYWVFTGLISLGMLVGGIFDFMAGPQVAEGMAHLGYPLYLAYILGVAKVLGVIAILTNKSRTLKEWAYAGFTFNLFGASISHLFSHDPVGHIVTPLVGWVFLMISYSQWRKLREAT